MKQAIVLTVMLAAAFTARAAARRPDATPAGIAASHEIAGTRNVDPRAWTELDIVPMPKNIRLTDKNLVLDPDKVVLVIGADACKQSQIGADWINQRLTEVGGASVLPVIVGSDLPEDKILIIIGTVDDNPLIARAMMEKTVDVGKKNPGERGYEVRRSDDGKKIYLAGADNIGALYACVTFGELLEVNDSVTTWRAAEVRDWPDLIWQVNGSCSVGNNDLPELMTLFSSVKDHPNPSTELVEEYSLAIRDYYDRLLRRKFSLIQYYSYTPRGMSFKPARGTETIRQGVDYGRERGIEAVLYAEQPFAGRRELYPEIATNRVCPTSKGAQNYDKAWIRCWSLDDITRKTARNLGEFVKAVGIMHVGTHDTDTGGYTNPAQWEERCDVCRKRWGDDYAAATINKHKIYYDEIKKLNPDARLHFTIYPYGMNVLDPELCARMFIERYGDTDGTRAMAEQYRVKYTEFWRRMHAAFPVEDVTFCVREAQAPAIEAFRALTPGRGMFTWLALMSHAWRPLFSEAAVWSTTFIDNPRDIFGIVAYLDGFVQVEGLAVREYSWNRDTPGAESWNRLPVEEQWRNAEPEGEIYTLILPRLTRNYFGRKAGPFVAKSLSQNVDLQQIFDRQRRQFTWLKDSERMRWQADNAERGARSLDEFWAKINTDTDGAGMDVFTLRRLINLRERLHMGMWMAKARAADMRARELAAAQDIAGAEATISNGLDYCRQGEMDSVKLLNERPKDNVLEGKDKNRWAGLWRADMADKVDFSKITERLERTREDLGSISALGAVPERVLKALSYKRLVRALQSSETIVIDGKGDEADWKNAMPVETFMILDANPPRPARAQTMSKIMFDENNIYLLASCWTVGEQMVNKSDVFELFLRPNGISDYSHYLIDSEGTLRQQLHKVVDVGGARQVKPDNNWKCAGIECAVQRSDQHWEAELKIPVASLAGKIGAPGWKINMGRFCLLGGGEKEISSLQTPDAKSFHDVAAWPDLAWSDEPYPAMTAQLIAPEFSIETMTLPDSIASVASFRVQVKTDRVLYNVKLDAEAYDADGKLQVRQQLDDIGMLMYQWESSGKYVVEYRQVHEQGGILLKLTCDEGIAEYWIRFGGWQGVPQAGSIFAPGSAAGQGLRGPCYFPDRVKNEKEETLVFNGAAGTLELWVKPFCDWNPVRTKSDITVGEQVFLHYGPIRKDNPRISNNSPMTIRYFPGSGQLYVSLLNRNHAGWLRCHVS